MRSKINYSILTVFGVFWVLCSNAQTYQGQILDENDSPLVNAYVSLIGLKRPAVPTDSEGKFEIDKVSNNDSLSISFVGYDELRVKALDEFMRLRLSPSNALNESVVEGDQIGTIISLIDPKDSEVLTTTELCKAACCNLSEAFETNASIDASFADAVTGTKQIQMLGLSGTYVQITQDNIPSVRGLSSVLGLSRIPGTWINSIYISKGAGSVTSGYESITGQINVATFDPSTAESSYINMYANQGGRVEFNSYTPFKVNKNWSSILLTHAEYNNRENDRNGDNFYDAPLNRDLALRNAWFYKGEKGLMGNYTINFFSGNRTGGLIPGEELTSSWIANHTSQQIDFSAKTGYVWPDATWHSLGSQINFGYDQHEATFGSRNYEGSHTFFRANLLYWCQQTDNWEYTVGGNLIYDDYSETLDSQSFDRTEIIPGLYFENTWKAKDKFVVVSGIRGDYHNFYGLKISPRLHARYSFNEKRALKLAAGIGYRSPVTIMDNVGVLASNRNLLFPLNSSVNAYGLEMESAVNLGMSYTHKFKLSYRPSSFSIDFYRTEFTNQVVVDRETPAEIRFYNLKGESYSNSLQVEFKWEPIKRLETRFAYRYLDVKVDYDDGNVESIAPPLIPAHRMFNNTSYKTKKGEKGQRWLFDITTLLTGVQRLPLSGLDDIDIDRESEAYPILNAQITREFSENFSFYVGLENALNYRQENPILSSEDVNNELFDASVIWAPIFGRMTYIGFRWNLTSNKE